MVTVSKTTKHKDPKTLRNYVHANDNILMSAGLSIGGVVSGQSSCSSSDGKVSVAKRGSAINTSTDEVRDEVATTEKRRKTDSSVVFNIYC